MKPLLLQISKISAVFVLCGGGMLSDGGNGHSHTDDAIAIIDLVTPCM